ncbi:MAG TPA: translation initiation factor IF-2 [Polyangiaceae bacterium]|nr:translation initiation factor IF-2 [Polyangiaceae bacterium]
MSSKPRVYEVARDLGLDNKAVVALFQSVGVTEVKNHMSAVAPEQVERVKRHLEKQSAGAVVEERISATVIKRRTKVRPEGQEPQPSAPHADVPSAPRAAPPSSAVAAPVPVPPSAPAAAPAAVPARPAPSAPVAAVPVAPAAQVQETKAAKSAPAHEVAAPVARPVEHAAPATPAQPAVTKPEPIAARAEPPPEQPKRPTPPPEAARPSSPPKTGIDVWEGRPGVPMPQARVSPRRVQYDAKSGTSGAVGGARRSAPVSVASPMPGGPRMQRGGPRRGIGSLATRRPGAAPVTQERSAHKKVIKIEESIGLQALAGKIGVKAGEVLMKLLSLGMTGVNINTTLDADTAKIVANEFGWEVSDVAVSEEDQLALAQGSEEATDDGGAIPRPPVVTVMGHVDHGKTSLLDRIRKTQVASGEAGGITQHIGAYSVDTAKGKVTFLDTPGHAAFTAMRARGAQTTDVVILVVAADDGVMPQTKEAIDHARAAKVPIVVAVNKMDKPEAQPERVRRELADQGLVPEEWGGETLFCEVSAQTGAGIDKLLESLALQAELLELRANPDKAASGVVIEAKLDRGRGPVATILVQDGTLSRGDVVLAGSAFGKVRALLDDRGRQLGSAGPSVPAEVIGLDDVPSAGDPVHVIKDLKMAQEIASTRKTKERHSAIPANMRVSLEDLQARLRESSQLELKVIIKADVQGSVEAVVQAVGQLSSEKVKVGIVHAGVGAITEGDVNLGVAAKAIIIGFNVRPAGKAAALAQKEGIEIRHYNVIYDVSDDIKKAMEGLLAPTLVEKPIGTAEVRQVFKLSKAGVVAGSMIVAGVARRNALVRAFRDDAQVWEGKLEGLRRFKEDVREVREGLDCGISLAGFPEVKEGDRLEMFEVQEVRQSL